MKIQNEKKRYKAEFLNMRDFKNLYGRINSKLHSSNSSNYVNGINRG